MVSIENSVYKDYPKTPTHTTLSNWIYKVGYYELNIRKKEKGKWAIILDHSIQIGAAKILVIYGIRLNQIDFTRPLTYTDLTPLCIKIQEKWKYEEVSQEIERLKDKLGTVVYAVADHESLLRKGLESANIPHIHDLTHKIALLVEKRYKEDATYKNFTQALSQMRTKYLQTPLAHLIPLSPRKKSLFQNIGKIAIWAHKCIAALDSPSVLQEEKDALFFLKEYKDFIEELYRINEIICLLEKELKSQGLSKSTIKKSRDIIEEKSGGLLPESKEIFTQLVEYLKHSLAQVKGKGKLLCTSDIIESAFGKYKNFSSDNKMACVTKMVLVLAAITVAPEPNLVKTIFESVKMKDIDEWTNNNIGVTSLKKRIKFFTSPKAA